MLSCSKYSVENHQRQSRIVGTPERKLKRLDESWSNQSNPKLPYRRINFKLVLYIYCSTHIEIEHMQKDGQI